VAAKLNQKGLLGIHLSLGTAAAAAAFPLSKKKKQLLLKPSGFQPTSWSLSGSEGQQCVVSLYYVGQFNHSFTLPTNAVQKALF